MKNEPNLRATALSLALQATRDGESAESIVARAEVFFAFLMKSGTEDRNASRLLRRTKGSSEGESRVSTNDADSMGALVDASFIAADMKRTSRTIRQWRQTGFLPPHECVIRGALYWRKQTYMEWKARALAGELAGEPRRFGTHGK